MSARRAPASPRKVFLGALAAALTIAGTVGLAESLRHPRPAEAPAAEEAADPRQELFCPDPPPREDDGQEDGQGAEATPVPDRRVGSGRLYDCPRDLDGRTVRYRGEVVGAVMRRSGGAWVQLNDDLYASAGPPSEHRLYRGANSGLGVFVPNSLADEISVVGGPGTRGDVLEVEGTFHQFDPASNEIAVIRAHAGRVVAEGQRLPDPPLGDRRVTAAVLAAIALLLVALERRRRPG